MTSVGTPKFQGISLQYKYFKHWRKYSAIVRSTADDNKPNRIGKMAFIFFDATIKNSRTVTSKGEKYRTRNWICGKKWGECDVAFVV